MFLSHLLLEVSGLGKCSRVKSWEIARSPFWQLPHVGFSSPVLLPCSGDSCGQIVLLFWCFFIRQKALSVDSTKSWQCFLFTSCIWPFVAETKLLIMTFNVGLYYHISIWSGTKCLKHKYFYTKKGNYCIVLGIGSLIKCFSPTHPTTMSHNGLPPNSSRRLPHLLGSWQ